LRGNSTHWCSPRPWRIHWNIKCDAYDSNQLLSQSPHCHNQRERLLCSQWCSSWTERTLPIPHLHPPQSRSTLRASGCCKWNAGRGKKFSEVPINFKLDRPSPSAPEVESNTRCIGVSRTISAIGITRGAVRLDLCFKTRAASAGLDPACLSWTKEMMIFTSFGTNCRV
jgi:hypothetical protein